MQANDLGQERGESAAGVSDEVESLIEALAYAQTRARRAEGLVEDYDLRIQAAVLKAFNWVQNAKNELSSAQKEKTALERELEGLRKRRAELRQDEGYHEKRWGCEGEEEALGSVWENSFVMVDDEDEREKEDEHYSFSINALSTRLIENARQMQLLQREYDARASLLNQLEVFIGPLLFWRNKSSQMTPHVHQRITALMSEMELAHGTQMFENVATRLLEMHQGREDPAVQSGEKEAEESPAAPSEHTVILDELRRKLLEAQKRFSQGEEQNEELQNELEGLMKMLQDEKERRIAAERRLAELEELMLSGAHHALDFGNRERRETLMQCYASSGGLERVKLMDDGPTFAGVHMAVDTVVNWLMKTLQRCEHILLASSRLWMSYPDETS